MSWVIGFKKNQLRNVMHSYALNVPVADRNFVLQYSVWVLGLLQLHHIAKVNYT